MKKTILISLFCLSIVLVLVSVAWGYPYYVYSKLLKNDYENSWYEVRNYANNLLKPSDSIVLGEIDSSNEDLWSRFHLKDVDIPLPVKNPFYNITTNINYIKKTGKNNFGLIVFGTNQKELLKVFFNQNTRIPNVLGKQKLFKLPIVKDFLTKLDPNLVWTDLFTKDLTPWNISLKQMVYNLYILELRSRIIPKSILSYSLIEGTKTAIIEVASKNKDYKTELVLTKSRGFIYSYLLITRLKNEESQELRGRLLDGIKFRAGSQYLSRIIYQEFKNLEFRDKTSNTGMLYLLSAWSQDANNEGLLQEMIYYLERGSSNEKQLIPLIEYAFSRYDKTFVSKDISHFEISDKIKLSSKVELERKRELIDIKVNQTPVELEPEAPVKDIFEKKLEAAKKDIKRKKNRMIIE